MPNTITVTSPKGTFTSPRYCVDGRETDHEDAPYAGDGQFAPFRVFDIDRQDYEPGTYNTREAAQAIADNLNA